MGKIREGGWGERRPGAARISTEKAGITAGQLSGMLGNTMTVPLVTRVIQQALISAGFLASDS